MYAYTKTPPTWHSYCSFTWYSYISEHSLLAVFDAADLWKVDVQSQEGHAAEEGQGAHEDAIVTGVLVTIEDAELLGSTGRVDVALIGDAAEDHNGKELQRRRGKGTGVRGKHFSRMWWFLIGQVQNGYWAVCYVLLFISSLHFTPLCFEMRMCIQYNTVWNPCSPMKLYRHLLLFLRAFYRSILQHKTIPPAVASRYTVFRLTGQFMTKKMLQRDALSPKCHDNPAGQIHE